MTEKIRDVEVVESKKALTIKDKNYNLEKPGQMAEMSKVLKKHIVHHKLFSNIQGKNYVQVEGWQFAGGLMGVHPRVARVEDLSKADEKKWLVEVEVIRSKDETVMSRGFAICSSKENKKKSFDEYAILSMAQTRAIGKAYRNIVGWVMKLSGYEATPSEEMTGAKEPTEQKPKTTAQQAVAKKLAAKRKNNK